MCVSGRERAVSSVASHAPIVCPGRPYIRSMLMFANPAALTMRTASAASLGVWMRPMSFSKRASKLCTPMDSRFTPISR